MRLNANIQLRKEWTEYGQYWCAYWRGTRNRVRTSKQFLVPPRSKQKDLRFDMLNNPMEYGVKVPDQIIK
jgi:hypothetical protein